MTSASFIHFQAILSEFSYIFGSFIKSSFQILNTIRLSLDIDDCKFGRYLNSPNC